MTVTLPQAVEEFLMAQAGEVSESTRRWYRQRLNQFSAFAGDCRVLEITPVTIRSFRATLLDRGMTVYSVHGYQRALRRFFSWMVSEHILDRNVARDVPLIRLPPQPPKALRDEDLSRFIDQLPFETVRDRAIILFLADTGCRVGGLCSLTLDSLDLPNRCATVIEKGRRGRRVYFTDPTAEMLKLYLATRPVCDCDTVFLSERGRQPLGPNGIRFMLNRIGKRAGVKGRCNAHSFRHAFARSFLRNGGNLAALGRILGHTPGSQVTARYYAVWDDRELQEFHERYSPIANLLNEQ